MTNLFVQDSRGFSATAVYDGTIDSVILVSTGRIGAPMLSYERSWLYPSSKKKTSGRSSSAPLRQFTDYVSSTWIESNTWPPSSWSVFMQSVRTNNDVEGWHHGLHTRAQGKSQLPMYLLIDLLYKEAKLTSLNVRMVSEKKLRRVQRRRYRQIQAKVFSLWGQYEEGDKTARQLLKACSLLVGPRGA